MASLLLINLVLPLPNFSLVLLSFSGLPPPLSFSLILLLGL
jgi:hypothetical protein